MSRAFLMNQLTSITRRRPSSTSRSFLLSSNFLICAGGICLTDRRPAPASRAASSVRSRAVHGSDRFLTRVCLLFHDTCFQHARDTRYRFHLGCDLSRRTRELEWSSSNVWRGCNLPLDARHVRVHVPAATLNLLRPCHIFRSSQISAQLALSVKILPFLTAWCSGNN